MKFTHSLKLAALLMTALLLSGALASAYAQGRGRGGGMGGGGRSRGQGGKASGGSDAGADAVRAANEKLKQADDEMRKYPGLAVDLNVSETQLHDGYLAALASNPNLKFSQFLEANRLALNLGKDNPKITVDAILDGVTGGKTIGQQLQELGLSASEAKEAEKNAERQIKESKKEK